LSYGSRFMKNMAISKHILFSYMQHLQPSQIS
jgi:hypothetical protein